VIRDIPIGWLMYIVAAFAASVAVILLALVTIVPDLWRAGQDLVNGWLAPEPSNVANLEERRRQLDAAAIGRRS